MLTEATKYYMGISTKDVDLSNASSEAKSAYLKIMSKQDDMFRLYNKFYGSQNPDAFRDIVDAQGDLANLMNDLAKLDNPFFLEVMRDYPFDKLDKEFNDMLQSKSYFPIILGEMGEDWYRHELGTMGLDFDKVQKFAKSRKYS